MVSPLVLMDLIVSVEVVAGGGDELTPNIAVAELVGVETVDAVPAVAVTGWFPVAEDIAGVTVNLAIKLPTPFVVIGVIVVLVVGYVCTILLSNLTTMLELAAKPVPEIVTTVVVPDWAEDGLSVMDGNGLTVNVAIAEFVGVDAVAAVPAVTLTVCPPVAAVAGIVIASPEGRAPSLDVAGVPGVVWITTPSNLNTTFELIGKLLPATVTTVAVPAVPKLGERVMKGGGVVIAKFADAVFDAVCPVLVVPAVAEIV